MFKQLCVLSFFLLMIPNLVLARLEVCNKTDLVLMVAVGYDTYNDRIASEGWWRLYPGHCEVPIDLAMLQGNYYVHAESNLDTTLTDDAFSWGNQVSLCVTLEDYRFPNAKQCESGYLFGEFNQVSKNWRNTNVVEINHPSRSYGNSYRIKVAGLQRMLTILGYDIGKIDGIFGEKTINVLDQIADDAGILGFDFKVIYSHLEKLLTQRQGIPN